MRYLSLDDSEALTLREGQRNSANAVFRQRCTCLLLSHQRCSIQQLASLYRTRSHTVRAWLDRYEEMGLVGLRVLPGRGRKPLLGPTHQPLVEAAVGHNRQSLRQASLEVSQSVGQAVSKAQLKAFLKSSAGVGTASAKASRTSRTPLNTPSKKPS